MIEHNEQHISLRQNKFKKMARLCSGKENLASGRLNMRTTNHDDGYILSTFYSIQWLLSSEVLRNVKYV